MDFEPQDFSDLKGIYSDEYIAFLKRVSEMYSLTFIDIYPKLPSPELVMKDEDYIKTHPVVWVLMGLYSPASYILTELYLTRGSIPDDYPEQPRYRVSLSEGTVMVPFTKTDFIESITKKETKKLIRK